MSSKIKYTDAPEEIELALKDAELVEDVLPSPNELVRKRKKKRSL